MDDKLWYQAGPPQGNWPIAIEPRHISPIGTPDDEPFGIYFGSESMNVIDAAIAEDSQHPTLGLLMGYPLQSTKRPFLLVTRCVLTSSDTPSHVFAQPPGDQTEAEKANTLFTSLSLDKLKLLWTKETPDECVVGWFHAWPRKGDSLITPYERLTHERLFTSPWQLALLIDTEQNTSIIYRWQDQELVPAYSFYFWNSTREPLAKLIVPGGVHPPPSPPMEESHDIKASDDFLDDESPDEATEQPPNQLWFAIPAILLAFYLLVSGAPGSIPWTHKYRTQQRSDLVRLNAELAALNEEEIHLQYLALTRKEAVREALAAAVQESDSQTTFEATIPPMADDGSIEPENTSQRSLRGTDQSVREYVIQVGDTMWTISDSLLGDPFAYRFLAEENDIDDPDRIFPGQRIHVPE